jgi:hypothetical protein
MAEFFPETKSHRPIERWTSLAMVATAILLGFVVLWRASHQPRTDDAESSPISSAWRRKSEGRSLSCTCRTTSS